MPKIYLTTNKPHANEVLDTLFQNATISSYEDIYVPENIVFSSDSPIPVVDSNPNIKWVDDGTDIDPDELDEPLDLLEGDLVPFSFASHYAWRYLDLDQLKENEFKKLPDSFATDKPVVVAVLDEDCFIPYDTEAMYEDNGVLMMVGKALKNNCPLIIMNYTDKQVPYGLATFKANELLALKGYDFASLQPRNSFYETEVH